MQDVLIEFEGDDEAAAGAVAALSGVTPDAAYGWLPIPTRQELLEDQSCFGLERMAPVRRIGRARVADGALATLRRTPGVIAVHRDLPLGVCDTSASGPGDPADTGDAFDLAAAIGVSSLDRVGADGAGVLVAVVDTGINLEHLRARGVRAKLDLEHSFSAVAGQRPGSAPVGHGTMCAYAITVAAPKCELLDIVLHGSGTVPPTMSSSLSDALRAFAHLVALVRRPRRPGGFRSLVVNNSWGVVVDPLERVAFGLGHDHPDHPLQRLVAALDFAGADMVFAEGRPAPAGGIVRPATDQHALAVAAFPLAFAPPSEENEAPDDPLGPDAPTSERAWSAVESCRSDALFVLCGYDRFVGSGVDGIDRGSSAAAAVVSGIVAALRSRLPFRFGERGSRPDVVRQLVAQTALSIHRAGHAPVAVAHGASLAAAVGARRLFPTHPPIRRVHSRDE